MSLIILLLVVLALAAVAVWAVDTLSVPAPLNGIAKVVIVVVALLFLVQRSGVL